jgi:hypothetical protein
MATFLGRRVGFVSFCILVLFSGCVKLPTEADRPPNPPVLIAAHQYSTIPSILFVRCTDPEGDLLAYQFEIYAPDVGSELASWTTYFPSGEELLFVFQLEKGSYEVRVRSRDTMGRESDFSNKVSLVFEDKSMTPVGTVAIPGVANDVAVQGGYAYVATGAGLQVVDVYNPASPKVVGGDWGFSSWKIDYNSRAVFLLGVSGSEQFLRSYDVSSPGTPLRLDQISIYDAQQLDVEGNYAIVGTGYYGNSMVLVDVTDPSHLVSVSDFGVGSTVLGVALRYPYAYVMVSVTTLLVVDLTNPESPRVVGSLALGCAGPISADSSGYLYTIGYNLLNIINANTPGNPELVSQVVHLSDALCEGDIHRSGNYLGVAYGIWGGFQLFDVTYPENPFEIMQGNYNQANSCDAVWCGDDYLYVIVDSGRLLIFSYPLSTTSPRIAQYLSGKVDMKPLFDDGRLKISQLVPKKQ